MFVKFKPSTSYNGWTGFINAIHAAATATAGSTPSAPTSVDYWEVISNTEAGGWSLLGSIPTSEGSGYSMELVAPSGQTRFRKRFKIYMNSNATNTPGRIVPIAYFDYDGSESLGITAGGWDELGARIMMTLGGVGTSGANDYRTWFNRLYPHNMSWYIAVTQEYLWISYQTTTAPFGGMPFGVSDLEGADDYFTNGNELESDWAVFYPYHSSNTGLDASYMSDFVGKMYSQNYNLYNRSQVSNSTAYWTHSTTEVPSQPNGIYTNQPITLRLGPNFEHSTATQYNTRPPLASRTGTPGKQKTLWPVVIGNPHVGQPFTNFKGMKVFADRDNQDFNTYYSATRDIEYNIGKVFTDGDGQKWWVMASYITNGAKRALRMA